MLYGCIGEKLGHSFSKEIHNMIGAYSYELREIPSDALDDFMRKKEFTGINVTIPYKERVMPHLYEIDEGAAAIGAVNTVVKRDDKLYGYNTDFYGMKKLLSHAKISVQGKKVAILGTGGTSKTARAVAKSLGAKQILIVSRRRENGAILLWSANTIGSQTSYRIVEWCDPSETGAFVNEDGTKAFKLVKVDSLYQLTAYAANGEEWLFDGQGGVEVYKDGALIASYEYTVNSFNSNYTVDLTVTIDGNEVAMRINYAGTKVLIETVED